MSRRRPSNDPPSPISLPPIQHLSNFSEPPSPLSKPSSMPRGIPTTIRSSSSSQHIPPILPLNSIHHHHGGAPTPPPILSLVDPALMQNAYDRSPRMGNGRPWGQPNGGRTAMMELRGPLSAPVTTPHGGLSDRLTREEGSPLFSERSATSQSFPNKIPPIYGNSIGSDSLKLAPIRGGYDTQLLRKLDSASSIPPTPTSATRTSPPRDRPWSATSDASSGPSSWNHVSTSSPRSNDWVMVHPGATSRDPPTTTTLPSIFGSREQSPGNFSNFGDGESHSFPRYPARSYNGTLHVDGAPRTSRSSYDSNIDEDDVQMDDVHPHSRMGRLTLNTPPPLSSSFPRGSDRKRRASSPPPDNMMTGTSEPNRKGLMLEGPDYHGRRSPSIRHPLRTSPSGHFKNPYSSSPHPRQNSFNSTPASSLGSSWSHPPPLSSVSTVGSSTWESRQPMTPTYSPHTVPADISRTAMPAVQSRPASDLAREKEAAQLKQRASIQRYTSGFICECCPKKPKKFQTQHDLNVHEMEKQYTCAYCNNRFKNKNEAERHQNSLHLRKQSWSCAALGGPQTAFHSISPDGQHGPHDLCGYCGKKFDNPADWEERVEHLVSVHKFGECNQLKRFYRADHFRQHLKHSHHGTSGKWTNILENSCLREGGDTEESAAGGAGSTSS